LEIQTLMTHLFFFKSQIKQTQGLHKSWRSPTPKKEEVSFTFEKVPQIWKVLRWDLPSYHHDMSGWYMIP
jgi:hypothetical protein